MRAEALLEGLNPEQQAAVAHTDGPLLVLAGAGSGKTRVITHRIAYLIATKKAAPENILAVTFTNKAAAEMRERLGGLIGKAQAKRVLIATFHAFCLKVLREHIGRLGYRRNFTIAGESDSRLFLRRVVDDIDDRDAFDPVRFRAAISLFKNTGERIDGGASPLRRMKVDKYVQRAQNVLEQYDSALRAANAVDFDDLLTLTVRLWREHPDLLAEFRDRFRYVLVDEYQDTNRIQFALIRQLAGEHRNLCVVGDDDQSIYAWRGADPRNILEIERDFPETRVIPLEQNYRSTGVILEAANAVIGNNKGRRPKKLWSALGQGRPIDWMVCGDEEHEAKQAAAWLHHIRKQTGAGFSDFALLYRSNMQARPIETAFRQAKIPYSVVGGQEFYERAEVKDVVSYLKALANPWDEAALLRIVNTPRRRVGDATLHTIHELCAAEHVPFAKGMGEALKRGLLSNQAAEGLRSFLALMKDFRQRFRDNQEDLQVIAADLVDAVGYFKELDRICKTPAQRKLRGDNVYYVLNAIGSYAQEAEHPTLAGFLDDSALTNDSPFANTAQRRADGVTLMTIHSAKGLEFPFVFVMGVEEGLLPHERSVQENGLDEERRLFYVALTRGRRHVTLFEALSRTKGERERMTETSRFMKEIPAALLNRQVRAARDMVADRVAPEGERITP